MLYIIFAFPIEFFGFFQLAMLSSSSISGMESPIVWPARLGPRTHEVYPELTYTSLSCSKGPRSKSLLWLKIWRKSFEIWISFNNLVSTDWDNFWKWVPEKIGRIRESIEDLVHTKVAQKSFTSTWFNQWRFDKRCDFFSRISLAW